MDSLILIVDDDIISQKYLELVLSSKKRLKSISVNSGERALNILNDKKFKDRISLILMDVVMEPMDGYETTKEIRKTNADIPIIGISAHFEEGDHTYALDIGMISCFGKPVDGKQLRKEISKILFGE